MQQGEHADIIIVDPPRKGCSPILLETIFKMSPKKIVMISCNSATMARDIKILTNMGYNIQKIQPVDMFPRTGHVECVSVLTLK